MRTIAELTPLLAEPREDLGVECKGWLDLGKDADRAKLAKAAIAMANHGGGFVVIGLEENGIEFRSSRRPDDFPEVNQDRVNSAVLRFASQSFHCDVYQVSHPETDITHPIVDVPGNLSTPVMSKRGFEGILVQNRCYTRKPGPASEEPRTHEEWNKILRRCLQAQRESMLNSVGTIDLGRIENERKKPTELDLLVSFSLDGRDRWMQLTRKVPGDAGAMFPHGYYEMGFSMVGARAMDSLPALLDAVTQAGQIRHSGWPPFLNLDAPELKPYANSEMIEAWLGRRSDDNWKNQDPGVQDFWQASLQGELYTIRGYMEDGPADHEKGAVLSLHYPISTIAEGIFFAERYASHFHDTKAVAMYCRFTGLDNRSLVSGDGRRDIREGQVCRSDKFSKSTLATLDQIREDPAEIVHGLLKQLYERFDFFELPIEVVRQMVTQVKKRRL